MYAAYYEGLQDKLTQLNAARDALDALREEHREKKRLEAEEAERQRQIQMAQKLAVMRQKKQVCELIYPVCELPQNPGNSQNILFSE